MSILHHITHSCKEAQMQILKEEQNLPVSFIAKIKQRIHLSYCRCCSHFVRQNAFINNALKNAEKPETLSENKRNEIQEMIDSNL